ncbi:MAG: tetratricopeptide repeat protein [Xanthomonadales bacterium]
MFWFIAAAVLFAGLFVALFPMLRGKSFLQPLALALVFALPAAGLYLYKTVGTPAGIGIVGTPQVAGQAAPHTVGGGEMEAMIAGLQERLAANPEDLDGWMLLARSLRSTQQHAAAAEALERAFSLAPDNPIVMIELAESWVFLSPDGRIPDRSMDLLERAVEIQPGAQKGLWLLGMGHAQRGDDAFAISYWQSLMEQLEPGSNVAATVQRQIADAQARLGMTPDAQPAAMPEPVAGEPAAQDSAGWAGTRLVITAADGARAALAQGAVLYVVIRTAGPAMGPPLGVRRVANPTFPLELTVTDEDSMLKERLISSETEVQFQARVSLTGSPTAQAGDWQSASETVERANASLVVLNIDQQLE